MQISIDNPAKIKHNKQSRFCGYIEIWRNQMPTCQKEGCGYKLLKCWKFCPKCGTPNNDNETYPLRKLQKTNEALTHGDWEIVRKLRPLLPELGRRDFTILRRKRNKPVQFWPLDVTGINQVFAEHKLCYRLMVAKKASRHDRSTLYKIYKTVPR